VHVIWLYPTVQKAFQYDEPFRRGPRVWQTDRQRDGRTDRRKPYSADKPISIDSKTYITLSKSYLEWPKYKTAKPLLYK